MVGDRAYEMGRYKRMVELVLMVVEGCCKFEYMGGAS